MFTTRLKIYFVFFFSSIINPSSQGNAVPANGLLNALGYSSTCVSEALSLCSLDTNNSAPLIAKIEEIGMELKSKMMDIASTIDQKADNSKEFFPRHCLDLLKNGKNITGIYTIYPYNCCPKRAVKVYCDQETDGGGWTVIQRRVNLPVREDFARTWIEYALGFGDLKGEFWQGLDDIHALTNTDLTELRIDLEDYENERRFAKYGRFHVGGADTKYILNVGRYSGDAGDGFLQRHTGHPFSTIDQDNDTYEKNCAELYPGGWWFDSCHISNINGQPLVGSHKSYADGITWRPFKEYYYSLKTTVMMIRPAFHN